MSYILFLFHKLHELKKKRVRKKALLTWVLCDFLNKLSHQLPLIGVTTVLKVLDIVSSLSEPQAWNHMLKWSTPILTMGMARG